MTCVLNSIKGLHVLVNNTDIHVYGLYLFFLSKYNDNFNI